MKRRQTHSIKNSYASLEKRQMLSADLDAARNLVIDGDFENQDQTAFVAFSDGDDLNTQEIRFRQISTSFSRIVELDSGSNRVDSLYQDVSLTEGADYLISFDLRGRGVVSTSVSDTNDVEVLLGGESLGVFSGLGRWQTINIAVNADQADSRLEFREVSDASNSDGRGILLDHVSIAQVREIGVTNGSFEEVEGDAPFIAGDVPGLFAIPNIDETPVGVQPVADAADGDHVLAIDTSSTRLDRVFQNVRTEAGANYFVTFDLRNVNSNNLDSSLRVKWNSEFAEGFRANEDWQSFGILVNADSEFSTLLLRESSSVAGSGLQIDNVRIFKVGSLTSDYELDLNGGNPGTLVVRNYIENVESRITPGDASLQFNNGTELQSATVRVLDYLGTESLSANTDGTKIQANFNNENGILRLVGRDSVENYQSVLRSLRYNDSSDAPTLVKNIVVSVTDGTVSSERADIRIDVTPVNDAPRVTQPEPITASFGQTVTIPIEAFDPDNEELDFAFSQFEGDTEIFSLDFGNGNLTNPTISEDGELEFTAVGYGNILVDVAVIDPWGTQSIAEVEVNVPFESPSGTVPNDFQPFSGERQLSNVTPSLRNEIYDSAPEMTIDTNLDYQAVIETSDGIIRIDLFENESPITVNNFVNLAEDGYYDGLTFHRVLPNFVAQGGDPTGVGSGGPGYQFVDELNNGLVFSGFGQLAMANSGPNTNGSQFFFTLNENPAFAGDHTIFGDVTQGENVLLDVNLTSSGVPEVIQRVSIEIV